MASEETILMLLEQARKATATAPQEALGVADEAIALCVQSGDSEKGASAWRVRAQVLRVMGRHAEAVTAFESAALCAQAVPNALLAAQVQIGSVDSLGLLGRHEEAVTTAQSLVTELRRHGADLDAAKVLFNLGNVHYRQDRYAAALDCYRQATQVVNTAGDAVFVAHVQTNQALMLTYLHREKEALELYEQARATLLEQEMLPLVARVDTNIGFLHYLSGELSTALAVLNRARAGFTNLGQELGIARCDADMANVYRALNLYPEALTCFERAGEVFARIALDYDHVRIELGRAATLAALGRTPEAKAALERAEQVFRSQKNHVQHAHVLLMQASLLRSEGNPEAAQEKLAFAERVFRLNRLTRWVAEARFLQAEMALEAGEDTTRRIQAISRTARKYADGWLECRAQQALGRYYAQQGDTSRAFRHFRTAIDALESARTLIAPEELHIAFLRDKLSVYEDTISTLLSRRSKQDIANAFLYVERSKSRLLLERVQSALDGRLTGNQPETAEARERLATLRAELSRGYHRIQATGQDDTSRFVGSYALDTDILLPLEQEYRATLQAIELANLTSRVNSVTPTLPIEVLQTGLEPEELLVEFYTLQGEVCAFVLTRQGVTYHPGLASLEEVNDLARRLRYHIQKAGITEGYVGEHNRQLLLGTRKALAKLYDLLLRPLESLVGVEKLVVVPHGNLHGLPFHAFYDGEQYGLDRWEITYAPSASVWYNGVCRKQKQPEASVSPPTRKALLMGLSDAHIGHVQEEIAHLAHLLPDSQVMCEEQTTVEAFRNLAGEVQYLHLATHGLFRADNPLFSGLRFADGWLLARDLYEMTLKCDLATLSACRTGVSNVEPGDELFGLVRGFLSAGARSLAVSLWPADDAATAMLMRRFYTLLFQGHSKSAALRMAQCRLRETFPHPYHWAAFAMVGER